MTSYARFLAVIAVALTLHACDTTRQTPTKPTRPSPPRPVESTPKPAGNKVDTIKWSTTDPKTRPPITDGKNTSDTKPTKPSHGTKPKPSGKSYTIGLLLPFQSKTYQANPGKMPEQSELALQFYGGVQLALAQASETIGTNLKVEVVDTDLTDEILKSELNKINADKWDVIIGPMRSSQVQVMANRSQTRGTILISPQSVQPNLVRNYPRMVQTPVGLEHHCRAIGEYVLGKYKGDQIVLVCREKEKERLEFFKKIHGWPTSVRSIVVPDNTASFPQSLKTQLSATKPTAFILPSFGSQDFVNGFLTKLRTDKGKNEVAVFGLPQWEDFSAIEYDLYEATNTHISRDYWWNEDSSEWRTFQKTFFDQFGTVPSKDAVKGYDLMRWVSTGLDEEGLDFAGSGARYLGLGYRLKLQSNMDANGSINYIENIRPWILKFENFQLLPVDLRD